MKTIEILFWISIIIITYTYVGYGIVLYFLVTMKRLFVSRKSTINNNEDYLPEVTILIAAYNEKDYVHQKVKNSHEQNYPNLKQVWVTDGSNDGTPELLKKYDNVEVLHLDERNGKIAAMNRGIKEVKSPIVVFTDANTMLGKDSIQIIVDQFKDPKVGCVSGEKRIVSNLSDAAAAAGEGLYWKYESTLKKWDAELNTAVGAAGELFAVRRELFEDVEKNTVLDDFIISLQIAMKGYKIAYNPNAFAIETASANIKEEFKRKVRICAGGIQSVKRLWPLLNFFKYKLLSFQYISHRVLRWTLAPLALLLVFALNIPLLSNGFLYQWLFIAQLVFYSLALIGYLLETVKIRFKLLFVPFYFFFMNYAVFIGFWRFIRNKQSVKWERAVRG